MKYVSFALLLILLAACKSAPTSSDENTASPGSSGDSSGDLATKGTATKGTAAGKLVSAPTTVSPEEQAAARKLEKFAGPQFKKGTAKREKDGHRLFLPTPNGPTKFDLIADVPLTAACGTEKEAQRKNAGWWIFEGATPMGLQLTRTSATYWMYEKEKGCLVTWPLWEASFKEKGARSLFEWNVLLYGDSFPLFEGSSAKIKESPRVVLTHYDRGTLKKKFQLFPSEGPWQLVLTPKQLQLLDSQKKPVVQHSFKTPNKYDPEVYRRISLLKNKGETRFLKIESSRPDAGADIDDGEYAFEVLEILPDHTAIATASNDISYDYWGKSSTYNGSEYRKMERFYATPGGKVTHLVSKVNDSDGSRVEDAGCEKDAADFHKMCPPKNKQPCVSYDYESHSRITTWHFTADDKTQIELFKQDWSKKTKHEKNYDPDK